MGGKGETGREGNVGTRFIDPVISGCDAKFVAADKLQTLERAKERGSGGMRNFTMRVGAVCGLWWIGGMIKIGYMDGVEFAEE